MMSALAVVSPLLGEAQKKSSSGGSPLLLILIVIAAGFYFLIYRPQQRKAKAQREQKNTFDVGDEVLTAGGIVGYVIDIDGDRVTLETSVGASFVVLKQYVLRQIEPPVPAGDDEAELDEESEGDDHDESGEEAGDMVDPELDGQDAAAWPASEEPDAPIEDETSTNGGRRGKRRRKATGGGDA